MGEDLPEYPSAIQLAAAAGDRLPFVADLATEHLELVGAVRELTAAVVATDVDPDEAARVAGLVRELTGRLDAVRRRPATLVARHADGTVENLSQAGSGWRNPQAPPIRYERPAPPLPGPGPHPVELVGRVTLTDAHGGPPGRAHGGVVATLLDETLGRAAILAGATGLTAGLDIRFRAPTPIGVPLTVTARWTRTDGRRQVAAGEVRHGEVVTAEGTAVLVTPRATSDRGR
jgi:acyl-coenzyme A thioesterase PaaI-like protein